MEEIKIINYKASLALDQKLDEKYLCDCSDSCGDCDCEGSLWSLDV